MRLISFLGTGKYRETSYKLGDKTEDTEYITFALSQLLKEITEVHILATEEAQDSHKEGLLKVFKENTSLTPKFITIPNGGTQKELWDQFSFIKNAIIENKPEAVAFDITHGFRAQPFFAAAVISYLRATDNLPDDFQVYYGEFHKDENISPIWDVSAFVSLMNWAHALNIFNKTGSGQGIAKLAEKKKSHLFKSGEAQPASLGALASALNDFSNDLSTIRCQSLITGANNKEATSKRLCDMIEQSKKDVEQHLPPLIDILEELKQQVSPIHSKSLFEKEGLSAMKKLSKLYLQYNRYPESLVILREGWVSTYSDSRGKTDQQLLKPCERREAEKTFRDKETNAKTIADFRNDVQHGGFREKPTPAKTIQENTGKLIDEFNQVTIKTANLKLTQSTTYFISRHPGAIEWAKQQGIQIDKQQSHFDIKDTQPNDTIIGTLPINLIAEVCQRGGKYLHLSLDLPADMRGKELNADDMQRYGARLEAYSAKKITL